MQKQNNSCGSSNNGLMKAWETTVRRAHYLFSPTSVAPADDDSFGPHSPTPDEPSGDLRCAERFVPNGDFYTGRWSSDNLPHSSGKYLWADGCMYEGQWRRGCPTGHGKFSWPSAATYEGHFEAGYMEGLGKKSYSNGDFYDGEWRSGLPDGHGRYIWDNGNEYSGEWRAGVINGKGSFVWVGGGRYVGGWKAGRPTGSGTFLWADGSRYIGVWSNEEREQKGIYYPSPAAFATWPRDPNEFLAEALKDCKIWPGDSVSIVPSQKSISWSGIESKPSTRRRASVGVIGFENCSGVICDSDGNSSFDADGSSSGDKAACCSGWRSLAANEEQKVARNQLPVRLPSRQVKKQGDAISKGHRNYELMLNLQLGIRHAVGKQPGQPTTLDLKASAFDPKEKVRTRFPHEGTKYTPAHQSCDFKWKDYCPLVFRTLRMLFKVDAADYMNSICGDDALKELSSPGKSGSFFYLTNDDRYMIKTMKKSEAKVLRRMLPAYYNHVHSFENTLVTRFFGLHCVKLNGLAQRKVRFVIMANLFCSEYAIQRRFDLKGSSLGRITGKAESEIDETTTLKDLDLNFLFRLQKSWFMEFHRQVERDCELLEQERIMDYSLLVGLHFRETGIEGGCQSSSRIDMDSRLQPMRLGVNLPSRVERMMRKSSCEKQMIGEPTGKCHDVILFFGIIDILQDYDISKKLEHAYKSIQYDPASISAVEPKQYAKRFRDFICKVFIEDR